MEELSKREAYLEGRLIGLNELVLILKETIEAKEAVSVADVVRSVVRHISREMEGIIAEMRAAHGAAPELVAAERRLPEITVEAKAEAPPVAEAEVAPELKKKVMTAEELLSSLIELRERKRREAEEK